ncbi:hypothetical protein D3C80_1377030 [compost metagenome]
MKVRLGLFDQQKWQTVWLLAQQEELAGHEQQIIGAQAVSALGKPRALIQQPQLKALKNLFELRGLTAAVAEAEMAMKWLSSQ